MRLPTLQGAGLKCQMMTTWGVNSRPFQLVAMDVENEPGKLAQALSELLYTREELLTGCTTRLL